MNPDQIAAAKRRVILTTKRLATSSPHHWWVRPRPLTWAAAPVVVTLWAAEYGLRIRDLRGGR